MEGTEVQERPDEALQCADVLIIGAGLAGVMAALTAREAGADVLLVCSGELGTGGDSAIASGGLAVPANTAAGDSPEIHYRDTLASGAGLCTPEVVRRVSSRAVALIDELSQWGAEFARHDDGRFAFQPIPGHSYPRSVRCSGGGTSALMRPLGARLAQVGVRVRENAVVLNLLTVSEGEGPDRVVGAAVVDERDGSRTTALAASTVLATGGLGQLFLHTSNNPDIYGSGYALALQAGCSVADLEFVQFTPTALVYPEFAAGMSPGGALMAQPGVYLRNSLGERFMERYDPVNRECTTRDVLSRAIFHEVSNGRGTNRDGVHLDLSGTTRDAIADISGRFLRAMDAGGFDPFSNMVEVAPEAHFCMGGVPVDDFGQSELPGLFVAGEASAGMHGANRLNSNALTEAAVMGEAAGDAAADRAARVDIPKADEIAQVRPRREDIGPAKEPGFDPVDVAAQSRQLTAGIRQVIQECAGVVRDADKLALGRKSLQGIRAEAADLERGPWQSRLNGVAISQMCLVGEAMILSAESRCESRGSHFRNDHPETSTDHPDHNVVRLAETLSAVRVTGGELATWVRDQLSAQGAS